MVYSILNETQIDLGGSIIGFDQLRFFRIDPIDSEELFYILQSEEDPGVGFVVVSPFDIYPDYEFKLNDEIIESLQITQPEEVAVVSIVTVRAEFRESTINLLAPVVINIKSGEGKQFVLTNSSYKVDAPLVLYEGGM